MNDNYKHLLTQIARPSYDPGRTAKLSAALDNRLANFRRLRRMKRIRKIRGLSAKQLMERKMSQRAAIQSKPATVSRAPPSCVRR